MLIYIDNGVAGTIFFVSRISAFTLNLQQHAEMAEWSNAHDSKSCYVGIRTGVQIPLSAPIKGRLMPPFLRVAERG